MATKKAAKKKRAPAKKKAAKKKRGAKRTAQSGNLAKLTRSGVVPKDYSRLTTTEKKAIESLSATEVKTIISAKGKLGRKFFSKHAPHGMLY